MKTILSLVCENLTEPLGKVTKKGESYDSPLKKHLKPIFIS